MKKTAAMIISFMLVFSSFFVMLDVNAEGKDIVPAPFAGGSFGGGNGTVWAPYIIEDVDDLQNMSANLTANYTLANDIDASATSGWNWNGTTYLGFLPIGNGTTPFTGSLDGAGYKISNLTINRSATNFVGLIGCLNLGASISNVGIVNGNVIGADYVGGLVGFNSGNVLDSYATGNVSANSTTGGLVGVNSGVIDHSHTTGIVNGTGLFVGGLAGGNDGTVDNSFTTGNVSGTDRYVGGLLGANIGGTVNNCYATGNVSGGGYAGGLVGNNSGMVNSSYATGDVSGANNTGGLLGYNLGGTVFYSFATGIVDGDWYVGGLVGYNYLGAVNDSYVTGDTSGNNYVGGLVGLNAGTISDTYVTGNASGTDYVGGMVGYNLYLINTSYAIGSVGGRGAVGGLTGYNDGTVNNSYATGNVIGINDYVGGLAGWSTGTVSNSYATGNVRGTGWYVGGLVGQSSATITNSYATGNASGTDYVGGLVGENNIVGQVTYSYATGDVNGTGWYAGGLVGYNDISSIVSNSYARGNVTGNLRVGGLVGLNNDGKINNSYSTGNVSGNSSIGGLIGYDLGSTPIQNSFWDIQTSGLNTSSGGTGKNTTEMKSVFTFVGAGWDFNNTWAIRHTQTYPFLGWSDWNNAPTAVNDSYVISEDGVLSIPLPGLLANDDDEDDSIYPDMGGYHLSVAAFDHTSVQGAFVNVSADGSFTYGPTGSGVLQSLAVGEYLTDSFTYTVSDDLGGIDTAMVYVNVTGVNDAPVANDDFNTIDEDTFLNVAAPGVLGNDTDTDTNDILNVQVDTLITANGASVTINADGSYTYDPTGSAILQVLAVGEFLVDTFSYTVTDGNGGMDTATAYVNVTGMNDDPTAADDLFNIQEDSGANALDVLVNDIDADGSDTITITDVTQGAHGTVVITGGGTGLTYEPDLNYSGIDTFTYNISDGSGVDTAVVTVIVNGTNDAPVITSVDDPAATENILYAVYYEATDADGDTLAWNLMTNATWLSINTTTCILSGTPTNSDVGSYWLNISVSDGNGGMDWTNFTLTVQNVNDNPMITTGDVTAAMAGVDYVVDYNAADIDSPTLTWALDTDAAWLSIDSSTGLLNGTSEAGAYYVNVSVSDGNGGTDWHNFTLTVLADTDGDGIPDNQDTDDDNDGWNDTLEILGGTDPLDNSSVPGDADSDGIADFMDPDFLTTTEYNNQTVNQTVYSNNTVWHNSTTNVTIGLSDADSDGDGWNDSVEILAGTDPLDAADMPADSDGDGIADFMDPDSGGQTNTVTETPAWAWGAVIAAIFLGILVVMGFMRGGKPDGAGEVEEPENGPAAK